MSHRLAGPHVDQAERALASDQRVVFVNGLDEELPADPTLEESVDLERGEIDRGRVVILVRGEQEAVPGGDGDPLDRVANVRDHPRHGEIRGIDPMKGARSRDRRPDLPSAIDGLWLAEPTSDPS
ncbi:MAG: hypothetical protein ACREMD_05420 [Gemmatimonadota bacterium]